jgi:hypothetical protein
VRLDKLMEEMVGVVSTVEAVVLLVVAEDLERWKTGRIVQMEAMVAAMVVTVPLVVEEGEVQVVVMVEELMNQVVMVSNQVPEEVGEIVRVEIHLWAGPVSAVR